MYPDTILQNNKNKNKIIKLKIIRIKNKNKKNKFKIIIIKNKSKNNLK